jgi:hypothetical protein
MCFFWGVVYVASTRAADYRGVIARDAQDLHRVERAERRDVCRHILVEDGPAPAARI